ncbi:hypothetical protein KNP414_00090 [Paenibacillus mucilaginosus KNP414]|uniref:Uncharacterized protein n=1 Tax=Paenibacillus mucilaginosus (strain KNP414) TaxID=1036673 RepID=F8FJ28_PAEMK|nr:hypothetical protein KNP414_00090 [Paenibacillus mucilaginosus KNP414]
MTFTSFECLVNTLSDVRRLLVQGNKHCASSGVKTILCTRIPNFFDRLTSDRLNIYIFRTTCNLADYKNKTRSYGYFARYAGIRVIFEECIKDRVRDLVANLIRMSFGYGLRSEQTTAYWIGH